MTPCFPVRRRLSLPKGPFSPFGGRFGAKTGVFASKCIAPNRPGCSLRPAGRSMDGAGPSLRSAGWSTHRAGCSIHAAGTSIDRAGALGHPAGASLDRPGARPLSLREDPGAWRDHPAPRGCEPFEGSAETPLRLIQSAAQSARGPLGFPLCSQPFALRAA